MKDKIVWVGLLVASGFLGVIQSCISSPDSNKTRSISPGLYLGIFHDPESGEEDKAYYKVFSNGHVENRQYNEDSIVWFHAKGIVRFQNDSVYSYENKRRVYESLPDEGYWGEWIDGGNQVHNLDSVYVEIAQDYFELRTEPRIRFNKIGDENSVWPQSKNSI